MQKTVIEDLKKIFNEKQEALILLNKNDAGSNFDYDPVKVSAIMDAFNFYSKENLSKKDYLFFTNGNPYTTIIIYLYSLLVWTTSVNIIGLFKASSFEKFIFWISEKTKKHGFLQFFKLKYNPLKIS